MNMFNSGRGPRAHDAGRSSPLDNLRSEMEQLWDRFFPQVATDPDSQGAKCAQWIPTVDVGESAGEVSVRVELPGVEPADVDLSVVGDKLTVAGDKKLVTDPAEGPRKQAEAVFGAFHRVVRLPAEVEADTAAAEFKHGVLHIRLRKIASVTPKKIHVQG